jgi:hypothetical protein
MPDTMKTLAFCLLLTCSLAHAEVYKYIDANGNVTFTNVPIKGAKPMHLAPLSTYGSNSGARPAASPQRQSASTPDGYPSVDNGTQTKRDEGRRKILENELANEQKALADAQKAYTDGAATRNGDETRNYQKYLDRVKTEGRRHRASEECGRITPRTGASRIQRTIMVHN